MTISFSEKRFPTDISYNSLGGPEYFTEISSLKNGHEQRNISWQTARCHYNVTHAIKSQSQLDEIIAFFRARKGMAIGFRFKDWSDYIAKDQIVGHGDGATKSFQLIKNYVSGENSETRIITKPVAGTVKIYKNSVLQTGGFSIDHKTGAMLFNTPPALGSIINASFEFDVPVRFDSDSLIAKLDQKGIYSFGEIKLVEVKI